MLGDPPIDEDIVHLSKKLFKRVYLKYRNNSETDSIYKFRD